MHVGTERVTPEDVAYVRDDWFPIETAPTDGSPILVGKAGERFIDRAFFMNGELIIIGGNYKPTHWCHLPTGPSNQPGALLEKVKLAAEEIH